MHDASLISLFHVPGRKREVLATLPLPASPMQARDVVLVPGAFVDGGSWEQVYQRLTAKGYRVSVAQIPATSLQADIAATRAMIDMHDGPVILVGHSYGGVVISEAGNHPRVARLVYIAALVPDCGESAQKLLAFPPAGAAIPPIMAPVNGFLRLQQELFASAFAGDLAADRAAFLASAQRPWGIAAFTGEVSIPAWRSKPSWYLVAARDRMIPPEEQRAMAARAAAVIAETAASHAVHEARPDCVVAHIDKAARGTRWC